jgi:hypothetical protein
MDVFDSVFACPSCGYAMDRAGYHALTCLHAGSFGVRHNALREIFLDFLGRAGIKGCMREAPSLLPGSAARPADIFVPNFAAAQSACLDFAVTHTQQPNIIQCAGVCGGAAAEQYEIAVKEDKFGAECKKAGLLLVPMVVEVFGRWGERSQEAFRLIAKAGANRASEKVIAAGNHLRRSMSVGLQRLNARIMLSRMDPASDVFSEPVAMPSSGLLPAAADPVLETLAARPPPQNGMVDVVRLSAQCGYLTPAELTSALRAMAGFVL